MLKSVFPASTTAHKKNLKMFISRPLLDDSTQIDELLLSLEISTRNELLVTYKAQPRVRAAHPGLASFPFPFSFLS